MLEVASLNPHHHGVKELLGWLKPQDWWLSQGGSFTHRHMTVKKKARSELCVLDLRSFVTAVTSVSVTTWHRDPHRAKKRNAPPVGISMCSLERK